jgi:hypothetical protein
MAIRRLKSGQFEVRTRVNESQVRRRFATEAEAMSFETMASRGVTVSEAVLRATIARVVAPAERYTLLSFARDRWYPALISG